MYVCLSFSLSYLSSLYCITNYLRPRREGFCTGTTSSMSASTASPSSAVVVIVSSLLSSFSTIFAKSFSVSKVRFFSEPGVEFAFVLRVLFDPGVAPASSESVSISSSSSNEVSVSSSLAAFLAAAFLSVYISFYNFFYNFRYIIVIFCIFVRFY